MLSKSPQFSEDEDDLAFSLNRVFVVSVVFLGLFTILFGYMPSEFFVLQSSYQTPISQNKEVADFYSTHNLTLYQNQWNFNITLDGGRQYLEDIPVADHWLECEWYTSPLPVSGPNEVIVFRHSYPSWFFGLWRDWHYLTLTEPYKTKVTAEQEELVYGLRHGISKDMLLKLAEGENYSFFEVSCGHITANFVFTPKNESKSLEEAWDEGELHGLMSYNIDWDAMKPSAWSLIGQLLTFQSPDFGVPGTGGKILNYMIGCALWVCIAITIYAIATRLIPTIRGGIEG